MDNKDLIDLVDSFLFDYSDSLPFGVVDKLHILRNKILPLYDGNIDFIRDIFELINMNKIVENISLFWGDRIGKSIKLIMKY